ncbi:MAG: bifunctional metallophosphatase/5'-nucleotidase [Akkermansia sp.]|nr:bifunctional metallophosphatase/5'-nucleotidase [Akkermansia sp.]
MKAPSLFALMAFLGNAIGAQVTILGINDMHADVDNLPQLANYLKTERAQNPDILLLSAGDNRTGSPYVDIGDHPGAPMIQLMNKLGFNLSTLGNHEFDAGEEALRYCLNLAEFPFVCANVKATSGEALKLKPYHIFERNGVRIGVLGLLQTGDNGLPDAHPDQVKTLSFRSPFEVVRDYAYLREQCDVLILLTHIGFEDDVKLAQMFPEADAIIGGHSHTRVEKEQVINGVLITQTENKVKYLTKLTFDVENGKVKERKFELISLRKLPKDADMQTAVEKVKNNPYMTRKLTTFPADINRRESLGCLIADALRFCLQSDIAVVNMGNVRLESFPAGEFKVEDCYRLDPFGNKNVVMKLTGRQLIDFLNAIPSTDHHGAPCVSGLRYKANKPEGELKPMQVTEATMEDGTPLNSDAVYTVTTNSYLMATVPNIPRVETSVYDLDSAGCMIQFLDGKAEVDYSNVSRVELNICK